MVFLACAGMLGAGPSWAQAPLEEEPGEVLSEDQLEALLDSPVAQPSDGDLSSASFGPEQLAPYFAEGPLAKAWWEFRRGRYAKARRLLAQEPSTPQVRFLMAQSALRARNHAVAAEEFAALAVDYAALRDHSLLRAAQANERLRKLDTAAAHYRGVSPGSPLYPEARFSLSRVLQRRGNIPGALTALQELIDSRQSRGPDALRMKALLAICDLARAQGQYNAEHRALLEVWATSPLSREARRAEQRLKGLPLPLKWRVRRAEALVELHRNYAGMALLDKVLPHVALPDELACRAHLTYGRALRKERKHRRAIDVLAPMVAGCTASEQRPQALYILGYSQSVVDPKAAVGTYATLARDYPEHGYADDALFFEAWLLQRLGDVDTALARYEEAARRYPAGNFASESLFRAFWLHSRKANGPAALAALTAVENLPEAARTDEALWRARYWRARVQETGASAEAALDAYAHIAAERPAAWYGMLARSRLALLSPERVAKLYPKPAPPETMEGTGGSGREEAPAVEAVGESEEIWPLPPGALAKDARFIAGVELMRLGLPGAAAELLAVDARALPEAPARLLYQTLKRTGYHRAARQVARTSLKQEVHGPLSAASRPIWEATWPLAYRRSIARYARAHRVDPDLLQGLIREESRFNARARSATGALGLAQLMPATARQVADSLDMPAPGEAALLQPHTNIRLGAAYLGQLLKHFGGNVAYAVAAYNAGPRAVERWRHAMPEAELDEWVEHIGFEETRGYVKKVLGSYSAYKLLYADEPALAYRRSIARYARAHRVDPDLLQGLIREESRFNARARSATGALGLAQLMPATARQVADSLDMPAPGEAALLQPHTNIRLGAAYLGQLLKHFGGNVAYAVAAYNAGPRAVERWRHAMPEAELDEWVEHIGFEETRGYVKKVLGSYSAYKLLYADEPALLRDLRLSDASRR
ncbi:transglycosylase SLT domain-containing protein [Corallococcus macrosporus]|uniref:Transglycosylase SLT domain-containing protein n=1 Tax=Myxococcus fulvus (strain ATCC BAA-855 / HW-1) TaxID=483219 RepID=F8CCU3_MYXFH|nr:transglycosylase SLT domain-containing protein [Corallococcus macrosporus]